MIIDTLKQLLRTKTYDFNWPFIDYDLRDPLDNHSAFLLENGLAFQQYII